MKNYPIEWKDYINFKEVQYNTFIEEVSSKISNATCSQKVDGILGALIYEKGKNPIFQTTGNKFITNIPVLNEYKEILDKYEKIKSIVLMGELVAKKDNEVLSFNKSVSIVKTPTRGNNSNLIHHYLYDLFELNGNKILNYKLALNFIMRFPIKKSTHIHRPIHIDWNEKKFSNLYYLTVETLGFDGIVIRQYNGKNYKVKPFHTFDLALIGAGNINMAAWKKNQISYLIVAFIDNDRLLRLSSKIGTGFDFKTRSIFFDYIVKNKIYEKDGEFFIKPEKVVEAKFLRYNIADMPYYKFDGKKFIFLGKKLSATMINPRFSKLRIDKKVNKEEVGFYQVPELNI